MYEANFGFRILMCNLHNDFFRIKSRRSFSKCTKNPENNPQIARIKLWKARNKQPVVENYPRDITINGVEKPGLFKGGSSLIYQGNWPASLTQTPPPIITGHRITLFFFFRYYSHFYEGRLLQFYMLKLRLTRIKYCVKLLKLFQWLAGISQSLNCLKMKLTVCTDAHMYSNQVETKFEMLLEEYNTDKLILIGMPLEKLPLNCDGLPVIIQKIYDYISDFGLYDECLFDDAYSNNGRKESILNAYKLVSGSEENCRSIIDVDAVDFASVLVFWLYYLPKPLISSKQFAMICDLNVNKKYREIINSMDNINRQILQRVMNIVDSYEKQHKLYKEKLGSLFTLLLTKNVDNASQNKALQFIDNLKIVLMEAEIENNEYMFNNNFVVKKENLNFNKKVFNENNLCNKKNLACRSLSYDGSQLRDNMIEVDTSVKSNGLKKSSSCDLESFVSKEDDPYNKSFTNDVSYEEENLKAKSDIKLSDDYFQNSSVCAVDELIFSSQIDDLRSIERTMPTHSRSSMKRTKKKSIRSHVERVLKSEFLSNQDSLLLQNTLELMKILSKIKSVQSQINIHRRNWENKFGCENENADKNFPDLHFLNNRLEQLANQKNNYLTKTGLSYGRSYNRTVLNLKNAQKEAFKLYENEKQNNKIQNKNIEKLISNIYDIQIVLDYLENNCGGKELPWRSSKGCPGYKRMTKKQLNCVTVVSDLQTISEHEVMETIPQPLFIALEY
ncbi:Rho GTPase-activating protein domain,Rho GTPase activation protein [Cinara cedri]|uniref:Rho GTPase-activating protein domain,Rho GTPase activation protein n=1 Tax=Cinara cedri TaxID=506608 RepID=A0A5E4MI95_9HEMI|nr:Rho GTPase-activating protein domain,Rho GTPase activation protein [Cinara cedri]